MDTNSFKDHTPFVTVYTQVYNTKPFLAQCIESVLAQTFADFEYIVVDNGCTDGSSELLDYYSKQDNRIRLIRHEKNQRGFWSRLISESAAGYYLSILDSDDWWEPNYLSRLIAFSEENNLDIACTGTVMHHMASDTQSLRKTDCAAIIPKVNFAKCLPYYHAFCRTVWGKLIRTECFRSIIIDELPHLAYGGDTLYCFQLLRHAKRIGLDDSLLHHYRIHKKSMSFRYDPKRFEADVFLYNDAIDFLSTYSSISKQNRDFLQCVYANAVIDTVGVIHNSNLSPADKLREYRTIAAHPLTQASYHECTYDAAAQSRATLLQAALQAGIAVGARQNQDLPAIMQFLSPRCGMAVSNSSSPLYAKEPKLLQALIQDDPEPILENFLTRMEGNQDIKKFAIPEAIQAIAVNNPFLCQVTDNAFLRKYTKIYRMVWRGETLSALDAMTGLLLENQVSSGKETFLRLYVSLAAVENQAHAFVFGKFQLAQLYLRQGRYKECRGLVDELAEMGVDNEDLTALREKLERVP